MAEAPEGSRAKSLTVEALRATIGPYLSSLIRGYDPTKPAEYLQFTSEGFTIAPFELVQETLVALVDGHCPIASVKFGRTTVRVPMSLVMSDTPVTVEIESVHCDYLAFPDVMSKDRVHRGVLRVGDQA